MRSACHSEITRALVGETPGGGALAERHKRLDFRDPHTMALQQSLPTPEDLSALARSRVAETRIWAMSAPMESGYGCPGALTIVYAINTSDGRCDRHPGR